MSKSKTKKPLKPNKASKKAIQANPSPQEINTLLTLFTEERYPEVATIAQAMTTRFPLYGFGWKALGAAFKQLERSADALAPMQKAAALSPADAQAHYNLAIIFQDLGQLTDAEACYRRSLKINPSYAEAHHNLGNTLKDLGRLNEAEASYRQTLKIKPDYVITLNNLALLLNAQGKSAMALDLVTQSLQIKETEQTKRIFVQCVKHLNFTQDDSEIRTTLVRALNQPWGRPSDLMKVSLKLVRLNLEIEACIARAVEAWPRRLSTQDLFGSNGLATLATDPLLYVLLGSAPIFDIEMERFLTIARHTLLEAATGMTASDTEIDTALSFYSALTHQCFINEYAFSHTDHEIQKAAHLRDSLIAALDAKAQVPILWPIAVASYFPLHALPHATRLWDTQWPEAVATILVQQIQEPIEELQLRTTIPRLTPIEDEVSLLVQNQYEENPYPRWIKTPPVEKAKNIVGHLRQKFPLAPFKHHGISDRIDVLIAGCGTGQLSIETAQGLQGAQVLAVDLSMTSLGYAKRKTQEMGLSSIEYAQADLLKLGTLDHNFDIIDASGVLHHLADPWAGWQVLLSLLRPGGFMKLGFYSEQARRDIVKAQAYIAEQGYGSTANEIRRCRQDLMDLDKSTDFGITTKISDFFSISACRDLLFHVQEHRMTLADIEAFLQNNNLVFLGFDIDLHILNAYTLHFPDDRAAINLSQWQIFENDNPDTFIGMYQFWVQKTD